MKKLINTINNLFVAISFAEEGELEYSQVLINAKQDEQEGLTEIYENA